MRRPYAPGEQGLETNGRAMYEPDDEDLAAEEQAASLKVPCRNLHGSVVRISDVFPPPRTRTGLGETLPG